MSINIDIYIFFQNQIRDTKPEGWAMLPEKISKGVQPAS